MTYYLRVEAIQCLYRLIRKPDTLENPVPTFWLNFLRLYFSVNNGYIFDLEPKGLPQDSKLRDNFVVRSINNGEMAKFILILKNRRKQDASQTSMWKDAVDQLPTYLKSIRAENDDGRALYAVICIDTYVQFYALMPAEDTLQTLVRGKEALELAADEEEIHTTLNDIVQKIPVEELAAASEGEANMS